MLLLIYYQLANCYVFKAHCNNKEYVITQPFDEYLSLFDVQATLHAELKLLAQCNGIKGEFEKYVQEGEFWGVPWMFLLLAEQFVIHSLLLLWPAFYFNFKGSFYGEIEPLSASGHCCLPHLSFLATPLLPCGCFNDSVQKFTGNNELGPAKNLMTQAVHAFVYFAWIYSHKQLVFCDMQGLSTFQCLGQFLI